MIDRDQGLSAEESRVLHEAERHGTLTAQIYRDGVFSQPDFILLGVLQRLAIRGRLACLGLSGDPQAGCYRYAVAQGRANAAFEITRDAA